MIEQVPRVNCVVAFGVELNETVTKESLSEEEAVTEYVGMDKLPCQMGFLVNARLQQFCHTVGSTSFHSSIASRIPLNCLIRVLYWDCYSGMPSI
uniref:Uncharacterized protein n=1 Tax=Rhizophora mucronata TaxID=61149 RepID=A0A2P2J1X8_RHIMU